MPTPSESSGPSGTDPAPGAPDAPTTAPRAEHRLHPLSIPFWLLSQVRRAVLPLVFGAASASAIGLAWETVLLIGFVPIVLGAVVRYFTFRYRYEAGELVIRSGLLFRRERHIPYGRIQNLDAVEGVLHRVLGVVEVKIQTGGGDEPEASMTVLPVAAVGELRRRVFEGREAAAAGLPEVGTDADPEDGEGPDPARSPASARARAGTVGAAEPRGRLLLHLDPRELILYGLIQNRGMIVIGAVLGVTWETGVIDRFTPSLFAEGSWAPGWLTDVFGPAFGGEGLGAGILAGALLLLTFVFFVRLLSAGWALVRLYDYRVTRSGEDLRTTYGLFTRVTATIPLRRVQTVTIYEGPLHRLAKRVALRVETAGGAKVEQGNAERPWLAPIVARGRLDELLLQVVPELDLERTDWEPVAPGAVWRVMKATIGLAAVAAVPVYFVLDPPAWIAVASAFVAFGAFAAYRHVEHLGWSVEDGTVLFRSGWMWRRISVARFAKIQAVTLRENPFDRRRGMARLSVDTAGAGPGGHGVDVPYLLAPVARRVADLLATEAAQTAFRW